MYSVVFALACDVYQGQHESGENESFLELVVVMRS